MNWKKFILLSCVVPSVFAVPAATAQMRGRHPSTARMPMAMHRAPMLNSTSGFQGMRSGDFARNDRFRRRHRFNEIIIFDNFGFPFFPFYYPYPYYPYSYGSYYPYGGGVNVSVVVQVQRRLASAGFYSGPIDGVMGRGTRRAIRAFERSHGLPVDGTIHRRLLATMGLA